MAVKDREQLLTPSLNGRLWLLGALFLVALPHLLRFPVWLSVGCLALFAWRLLHEWRGTDLPGKWLRLIMVLFAVGAVLSIYHSVAGREPGVALLTVMLSLKLLELRTLRDAMIALFIGYFMVISGFLFSQSIFMGGYLFLVVLALTAALASLNHPSGNRSENRFYLAFAGKLLLQSLPLMVLMFVLFPRLSGPLWKMPDDKSIARTGLSDSMEIGTITQLASSEAVAFRVDFDGPIPPASQLYWRGPVLWRTNGRRWERQPLKESNSLPEIEPNGDTISYTVTLEPTSRRWLFALDLPVIMPQGLIHQALVRPDFQLLAAQDVSGKLRYHLRSATDYRIATLPGWMARLAIHLPPAANPQTQALAMQWRNQGLSHSAIVQQALKLFRDQPFYYTRQPPALGDNAVDDFLFNTRRGFCEHFAASFVTLMRAAGIPARVVTGYQGGERNNLGDYLIVRQSNAHAWAEVYLDNRGWVRVDPTAVIPPERVETTTDANRFSSTDSLLIRSGSSLFSEAYWQLRYGWDALNHTWNQWVLGFDRETQEKLLRKLGLTDLSWQRLIVLMVVLIAAVLTLIGVGLLWHRPRHRDPLVQLYRQYCRKLERIGIHRRPDEGPADFANRVIQLRPALGEAVSAITDTYIGLRYARHHAELDVAKLRQLVRAFNP